MDDVVDDGHLHRALAHRVRDLRTRQGLSLEALATRTGVSRSMISLIERGESSPTAVTLNRLATGLGVSLAALFSAPPEGNVSPLSRRGEQRIWRDPESGYCRRNLSAPGVASPIELVEVLLPAGARVSYDAGPRSLAQQIWVIEGELALTLGQESHDLGEGDCLAMHIDQPTCFTNRTERPVRYLVALAADPARVGAPVRAGEGHVGSR
jgi:transcriptional regulator with XRE-family HTH domain